MPSRPWARRGVVFGLAIVVALAMALMSYRYVQLYDDLTQGQNLLLSASTNLGEPWGMTNDQLQETDARLGQAQQKLARVVNLLDSDPPFQLIKRLPWLGHQASAAEKLAVIGVTAAAAGRDAVQAARQFNRVRDEESPLSAKVVPALEAMQPSLSLVETKLASIEAQRQALADNSVFPPLSSALRQIDAHIARAKEALTNYRDAQRYLPRLLGYDTPKTYLVLCQDSTEIFPAGGWTACYGLMRVSAGQVERLFFEDVNRLYERWQNQGPFYVEPPAPLRGYLLRDYSWALGEAGWFPDFPASAQQAQAFLKMESGEEVDGTIAIDFVALEELLKVIGPVQVTEYDTTVDELTVIDRILENTRQSQAPGEDRKSFVNYLARGVVDEVMQSPSRQWSPLLVAFHALLDQKHLLIYSNDADVQALLQQRGWDGRVKDAAGDYLMVVDTNVNGTKLNLALDQSLRLDVTIDQAGNARNTLAITYVNNFPLWQRGRDPQLVQWLMRGGLHGDYVRVLTPKGSRLRDVRLNNQTVGPEAITTDHDKATFARFFTLPSGATAVLSFHYTAPEVVRVSKGVREYRLLLQKQPGTRATPITVQIRLPEGSRALRAALDARPLTGDPLVITTDLQVDREIIIEYR